MSIAKLSAQNLRLAVLESGTDLAPDAAVSTLSDSGTTMGASGSPRTRATASVMAQGLARTRPDSKLTSPSVTTLPGVAEEFPITDLGVIVGKGLVGDKFILDGGGIKGLSLLVRRVVDGDRRGFDVSFQLTPARHRVLMAQMQNLRPNRSPLIYRGVGLGIDGVATYHSQQTRVGVDAHAPSDTDQADSTWVHEVKGTHGSALRVVDPRAARAARGQVSVLLRGSDAQCTSQLQRFVRLLGMQDLFAPPTPSSKQRMMLMRCLWQHDQAAAEGMGDGDLSLITPQTLRAKLKSLGFSDQRLADLHWKEVFPGHFSVIDMEQMRSLQALGARYLYSTVQSAESVVAILQRGQASSLRRFQEGTLISGTSSSTDFSSGGAVGVFTRLVTQDAISQGHEWLGRAYRVILKPDVLARTDWFGWNRDAFGKSWDLSSQVNFGEALVESIDNATAQGVPGVAGYSQANEIIFRTGTSPEDIAYVVASTAAERDTLIAQLETVGYRAPGGLSLQQFVRIEPTFFQYGEPVEDLGDHELFIEQAFREAESGVLSKLNRVLRGEPFCGALRAQTEHRMLWSSDPRLFSAALNAIRARGEFLLDASQIEALLKTLATGSDTRRHADAERLLTECAVAMVKTNSDRIAEQLCAKFSERLPPIAFDHDGERWTQLIDYLFTSFPSEPRSKMQSLVVATALPALLSHGVGKPVEQILRKHRIVSLTPAQLAEQLRQLDALATDDQRHPRVPWLLTAYCCSAPDAELAALVRQLLDRTTLNAAGALRQILETRGHLLIDNSELLRRLKAQPKGSALLVHLFNHHASLWLRPGHEALLDVIREQCTQSLPLVDSIKLTAIFAEAADNPLLRFGLRCVSDELHHSYFTYGADLRIELAKLPLFKVENQRRFIAEAIALEKVDQQEAVLRLAWLLTEPKAVTVDLQSAIEQILCERASKGATDPVDASIRWLVGKHGQGFMLSLLDRLVEIDASAAPSLPANLRALVMQNIDTALASKHPKVIALWTELAQNNHLRILPLSVANALRLLREDQSVEAQHASGHLLAETRDLLLASHDDETFAALRSLGVTRRDLGVSDDEARRHIALWAQECLPWVNMTHSQRPYLFMLLRGEDSNYDTTLVDSLLVDIERDWPVQIGLRFIELILATSDAKLQRRLIRLQRKLARKQHAAADAASPPSQEIPYAH